jgi:hypothetical protein
MRRYPAFLWVPVYIGSLLILNGGHPGWDPVELAVGIGLVIIACALATYLALGRRAEGPPPGGLRWPIGGVAAFYVVTATLAGTFAGPGAGIATLLAGVIPLTAVAIWVAHVRQRTAVPAAGDPLELDEEDHRDPVPGVGLDSERPLGDTPDAHDEIIPQDLPKDHPGRHAADPARGRRG